MIKYGRTDMAAEALGRLDSAELPAGITAGRTQFEGMDILHVRVADAAAGARIGKPAGDYYTLSINKLPRAFDTDFLSAASVLAHILSDTLPRGCGSFLIACLGNPDITPDALGPLCAEHILVTRHLRGEASFESLGSAAVLRTGVLGTTGIESADQIRAMCSVVRPGAVIVVDALAGAELSGLCAGIQVSTGGISPGSGVLNNRPEISAEFLGVPVISVGVPTVTDGQDMLTDSAADTFITPRNIDIAVRTFARLIAYGINMAIHPTLTAEDLREISE